MTDCPRYYFSSIVKNGKHLEKQRYRCKVCGFQFTRAVPRGKAPNEKALAVLLYTLGLSMNAIARLLQVSTPAVLRWIKLFAEKAYEKPVPTEAVIVELEESQQPRRGSERGKYD